MPPVSATRSRRRRHGQRHCGDAGGNLGLGVGRRRDAFLDERVPLVAVRALPDELGAAIAAAHAHVRVEVEDRLSRDLDVARDEMLRQIERRERAPRSPGGWPARAGCARALRTAARARVPAGRASTGAGRAPSARATRAATPRSAAGRDRRSDASLPSVGVRALEPVEREIARDRARRRSHRSHVAIAAARSPCCACASPRCR